MNVCFGLSDKLQQSHMLCALTETEPKIVQTPNM